MKGSELAGLRYSPLFPYFSNLADGGSSAFFTVITDSYVTDDSGTGVVHQVWGESMGVCQILLSHACLVCVTTV